MTEIHGHDIMVAGQNLEVRWGRNRTKKLDGNEGPEYEAIPGLPGKLPGIEEAAEMAGGSKAAPDLSKGVAIFLGGRNAAKRKDTPKKTSYVFEKLTCRFSFGLWWHFVVLL